MIRRHFKTILLLWLLCALIPATGMAAAVYINPDATYNGDGTAGTDAAGAGQAGAYNTINISYVHGNDYYFKCGTTSTYTTTINIDNQNGLNNNDDYLDIGAYYLAADDSEIIGVNDDGPPALDRGNSAGSVFWITRSDYIRIRHIEFKRGAQAINIHGGTGNIIEYCIIGENANTYGVKVMDYNGTESSTYGTIRYCVIDSHEETYGNSTVDGVHLEEGVEDWEVYNNYFGTWNHSMVIIAATGSTDSGVFRNKFYNNYMEGDGSHYCRAFGVKGLDGKCMYNEIYANYIYNTTIQNQINGSYNYFHHNIINTLTENADDGGDIYSCSGISLKGFGGFGTHHNEITNNLLINIARSGIEIGYQDLTSGDKHDNIIANNVIINWGTADTSDDDAYKESAILVYSHATILNNSYYNNLAYDFENSDTTPYTYEGTEYSAANFNALNGDQCANCAADELNAMADNLDSDPELIDEDAAGEGSFFPAGAGSPVVGAGYTSITKGTDVDAVGTTVSTLSIGPFEYVADTWVMPQAAFKISDDGFRNTSDTLIVSASIDDGDTVIVPAYRNWNFRISDLAGSSGSEITVKNAANGVVFMPGATQNTAYGISVEDSDYVKIDGTNYSGNTYGFLSYLSTDVGYLAYSENTYIEAHNIRVVSAQGHSCFSADRQGTRPHVNIGSNYHDLYASDCATECFYFGYSNWTGGGTESEVEDFTADDLYCYNAGWDCFQLSSANEGTQSITDVLCQDSALKEETYQKNAFGLGKGTANASIARIQVYDLRGDSAIYDQSQGGHTIENCAINGARYGALFEATSDGNTIRHLTIANTTDDGIYNKDGSTTSTIRRCIVCGYGAEAVDNDDAGTTVEENGTAADCADIYFEDLDNDILKLTLNSSGYLDQATTNLNYSPTTDGYGTTRYADTTIAEGSGLDYGWHEYDYPQGTSLLFKIDSKLLNLGDGTLVFF